MKLVGALSSPYTRRVAIAMTELGLPFEHEALSVFAELSKFKAYNPIVRAPSLVLDDGTLLLESNVIIDYLERIAEGRSLWPKDEPARRQCAALVGLAQTACDKTVQLIYERELRPAENHFAPWIERIRAQLTTACELLEQQVEPAALWLTQDRPTLAGVTLGVVATFMQRRAGDVFAQDRFPTLYAFRDEAEALPAFRQWAHPPAHATFGKIALWP